MSHSHPAGLLAAYNSLTDKHLAGYFNNTRMRRHLLRSGLITRSGRILSEKEYKLNIMKRDHQKYIRECLAQAIFHKVLDMERYHQLEIKKKLETLAMKERIQRFKGEHTRWSVENNMPILSPHPPVGPKTNRGHSVLVDEGHSSRLTPTAPRPYTAPGNMQPPIRLQPLPGNPVGATVPKVTLGSRPKTSLMENETLFPTRGTKAMIKFRNSMDISRGVNSYLLPNIKNYLMPFPPPSPPPHGKNTRESKPETWRRRRFRPTTVPNGSDPLSTRDSRRIQKTPLHSNAAITMIYLGKNVHLSYDFRDEIKVYQQHCGGENLCVYKGKLLEKETFQFISKRHHGFPFSLTFFLNGIQVNRLSSCCEYKHRKGSRLGGKRGYFGFVCVERSSPCYKCIIAMGLDKKPTKSKKEKSIEKREELKSDGKLRKDRECLIPRRNEIEGSKTSTLTIFSAQGERTGIKEVRTAVEELESKVKSVKNVWGDDRENILKYEYEEDFEVDEEKQDEKADGEGQTDDQMKEMSNSSSDDENNNLNLEKKSETSSQKSPYAFDNVKDEGGGCSESELEEDKQDTKNASSSSSRSYPCSSSSEDDYASGTRKHHALNTSNESARSSSSQELSENDPRKPHHLVDDFLEVEIEEQEIIKANVETKFPSLEESLENILKEETEKVTKMIAGGVSEKSKKHVLKEEKEKTKRKLWEGSTTKVKDKKAGAYRVEKGVGQKIAEALETDYQCHYDTESDASSVDDGEKQGRKPETDTDAALDSNLVLEQRAELNSSKEFKQVTSAVHTLEKKETAEEDVPQCRTAETTEEQMGAALWGEAGANEAPLGEWKPIAGQTTLAEQFTEERQISQSIASGAETEAEGNGRLGREELSSKRKEAARDPEVMKEDEAPQEQNLMQAVLGTEMAASEEEQGLEETVLASGTVALKSEHSQEPVVLRETGALEIGEAEMGTVVSKAVSGKLHVEGSEERIPTDLGDKVLMGDTALERERGPEEAISEEEEPVKERKEITEIETPLSSSTSEVMESLVGASRSGFQEICKEDVEREEVELETESNKEDDRKEMLPEVLDATGVKRKVERPKTPLAETESEREEVTGANEYQDEDTLEEEQKFKGEKGKTVKGVRPEEVTQAPSSEVEYDAADDAPTGASELTECTWSQGEDSPRERRTTTFEAVLGFEKTLENIAALRKDGVTEHRSRTELLPREKVAPLGQEEGLDHQGKGMMKALESEIAGKAEAPEERITTTAEAQEYSARDQNGLVGQEGKDKEESLQGSQRVGVIAMTQKDVSEGGTLMAGMLREEAMDESPEAEVNKECTLETGMVKEGHTERHGSFQGRAVVAEEDLHHEGRAESEAAAGKKEVLADSRTAGGETEANKTSSFSDAAGEETWHKEDELLGKAAAAQEVVVQETVLREEVPAVELTVTSAPEAEVGYFQASSELKGKILHPGQGQEEGETETTLSAESRQEVAETGSHDGGQESAVEEFRLGSPQERESEPSRESLQDVETLLVKLDCIATREKQEQTVQRESENTDISLKDIKA